MGSGSNVGRSLANMTTTCRLVVPWMRVSVQRVSQVVEVGLGVFETFEAEAFQRRSAHVRHRTPPLSINPWPSYIRDILLGKT
jgi:hypothetical protein